MNQNVVFERIKVFLPETPGIKKNRQDRTQDWGWKMAHHILIDLFDLFCFVGHNKLNLEDSMFFLDSIFKTWMVKK
jgi:hypothetical protein